MELLQNPGPWTADFFPIYQWDGLLFIGVSHPDKIPTDFSVPEKYVIVQSEAEALHSTWKQLQLSSHNEILNIAAQAPVVTVAAETAPVEMAPTAPAEIAKVEEIAEAQTVVLSTKVPPPHPVMQPKAPIAIPAPEMVAAKIIPEKQAAVSPPPHPVAAPKTATDAAVVAAPKAVATPEVKQPEVQLEAKPVPKAFVAELKPAAEIKAETKAVEIKATAAAEVKTEEKVEPPPVSQITPQINLNSQVEELVLMDSSEKEGESSIKMEDSSEGSSENQMPEGFMIGSDDAAATPAQILQPAENSLAESSEEDEDSKSADITMALTAKEPEEEVTSFAAISIAAASTETFDESATPKGLQPTEPEEVSVAFAQVLEIEENTKVPLHTAPAEEEVKPVAETTQTPAHVAPAAIEAKPAAALKTAAASKPAIVAQNPEPEEVTVMMTSQAVRETSTDNWVNDYLSKLNAHFKKSMLMILNGEKLHAWRWNEGYTPASNKPPTYNINTKSPFYVVAKTLKSYHGKVPMVGEMVEFNKFWNKDGEMGLFTVAPLIINGKLLGALITEGENDSIDLDKLDFTEKIAGEISQTLLANPALLKAA